MRRRGRGAVNREGAGVRLLWLALCLLTGPILVPGHRELGAQAPESQRAISAAEVVARGWLALLADGNYAASWQQASPYFRKRITKEDWTTNARHLSEQFRRADRRQLVGTSWQKDAPPAPPLEYVVLQWLTDLGQQRQVGERVVVVHDADGTWRAASYELWPNVDGEPYLLRDLGPRPKPASEPPAPPRNVAWPGGGGSVWR
jgi:hypothetical protein